MSMVAEGQIAARPAPDAAPQRWTALRIAGYVLCALWLGLIAYLMVSLATNFDADVFDKYMPRMLEGLLVTLQLVATSIAAGALLAIPVALARLSESRVARGVSFAYVYFFRGTPLLGQVFLLYYGAGQLREWFEAAGLWWFFREAYNCVVVTFILNTAAYQAEIFKTSIQSIPQGQWEAARSLGLSNALTFRKIILPQAMITALRPLGNEIILMIKGSAVASVVTVFDLMGATKLAFSRTYNFDVYLWAAIIYLFMVETLRRVWNAIEARLTRHLAR